MLGLGVCGAFIFESQPIGIYQPKRQSCLVLLSVLLVRRIRFRCSFAPIEKGFLSSFGSLAGIVPREECGLLLQLGKSFR